MKVNIEILNSSYWEHFKFAKELAGYLPLDHPKRIKVEQEINEILTVLKDNNK